MPVPLQFSRADLKEATSGPHARRTMSGRITSLSRAPSGGEETALTAARVTLLYVVFGVGLLAAAALVLPAVPGLAPAETDVPVVVGLVVVLATAGFVYLLAARRAASLRETTARLDDARRELSVLHRVFRHDVRNELAVVLAHADMLETTAGEEAVGDHCEAIRESCADLLTAAEKTSLATDVDRADADHAEIDLARCVDRAVERLDLPPAASLETSVPEGTTVAAHEYVEFALLELIENGFAHNDAAEPRVTVTADDAPGYPGWTRVRVADNGPGVPAAERENLESPEEPLDHSSGVGLWVASWIVYRSGGDFDVSDTPEGTCVTVRLPTASTASADRARSALDRFLA